MSVAAFNLSRDIDIKGYEDLTGFCVDLKRSIKETTGIRRVPVIYMTLIFLITSATFNPGFGEFGFYY